MNARLVPLPEYRERERRLLAVLALSGLLGVGAFAQTTEPARPWLDSVDAGYIAAQKGQKPVLVLISDDRFFSPFDKPLADATVAAKLDGWVLVRLGPHERDARQALGVASAPSLRVLTPAGRVVAGMNAVGSAGEIAGFLDKAAEAAAPPALAGTDVPSLVACLASPDAAIREAATRQLIDRRNEAAAAVVEALAGTNATARLAAADLLEEWSAPLQAIDPWQRTSVTPEKLAALKAWAATPVAPTTAPATQPYNEIVAGEELEQLIAAPTAAEARAVRERLIRFGDALLPEVQQRLRAARTPEIRQRLTALRYRLAASDAFAAGWPGGFDRLASADGFVRRAALEDLSSRVKATDTRLLLELFGDDDPVVREKALALLKSVGGDSRALVKLLSDPEPNVRAAVLKSLAAGGEGDEEKVDPSLAPAMASYIAAEKDPDLLVHAIHVIKGIPGEPAVDSLKDLLANPEWRIRAEAADALREKLGNYRSQLSDETKAKVLAALIKLLDDEEGFVVAKAVAALANSRLSTATEPMLKTISRRPEMAGEILKVIADDESMARLALAQLKELAKDPRAEVRALAVRGIVAGTVTTAGAELKAAITDPDDRVRKAGVDGIVESMKKAWPSGGYVTKRSLFRGETREKTDVAKWIDDYRAGKTRPGWLNDLAPTLETLARSEDDGIALQATVALCALAKEDPFLPRLLAAAKVEGLRYQALEALNWLPWGKRKSLFKELLAATPAGERGSVVRAFAEVPDPRGVDEMWAVIAAEQTPGDENQLLSGIHDALQQMYFGENYYNIDSVPAEQKKAARESLQKHAGAGHSAAQRVVALALMLSLDKALADETAAAVLADASTSDWLRPAALQVRLIALQDETQAARIATEAIGSPATRSVAVRYLAGGQDALRYLRGIYVRTSSSSSYVSSDQAPVIKAPAGLTIEPVRAAMKDADADTAAYAGYLAAMLGDPAGLKLVEDRWRQDGATGHSDWARLLYRAITKLNDDSKTPVLQEIYAAYGKTDYRLREFYWTIRQIKGENILKLRKTIRDEVGMDRLR